jgi:hypothetical protein
MPTNRFNGSRGKKQEGKMLSKVVNPAGIATVVSLHPGGSTLLKTGAGFARFTHKSGEEEAPGIYLKFVGEPYYHPEDTPVNYPDTWDVYEIKVERSLANVRTKLIPDAVYRGADETAKFERYHRKGYWKENGPGEDTVMYSWVWPDGSADSEMYGGSYMAKSFSVNRTLNNSVFTESFTFAFAHFTRNSVNKWWMVCDQGYIEGWPDDGTITPFNSGELFPSWVGYGPLVMWDEWHHLNMAHRFFTDDGKKLVFAAAMPQATYDDPPVWKLPGIYVYDLVTNTCSTLMTTTWDDDTTTFPMSINRTYPLSATGTAGVVTPITLDVDFTVTSDGAEGNYARFTDAGLYTVKHGETILYSTTDGGTYGIDSTFVLGFGRTFHSTNWNTDYHRKFFGFRSIPEQAIFVLVELDLIATEAGFLGETAFYTSQKMGTPILVTAKTTVHVFDLTKGKHYRKSSHPTEEWHFWPGSFSNNYWGLHVSSTPPSGETADYFYQLGFERTGDANFDPVGRDTMTNDLCFSPFTWAGSKKDSIRRDTSTAPWGFFEDDLCLQTVFGAVAASDKAIVVSIKHPYPPPANCYFRPAASHFQTTPDCNFKAPHFMNIAIARNTGKMTTFTPNRMYTSLYEIERYIP